VTLNRFLSRSFAARTLLLAGLAACAAPAVMRADEGDDTPSFTDKTNDALQKLQPLLDAKNWDAALGLLATANETAGPESYDRAIIMDMVGKIHFQKDEVAQAITAWEETLRLDEAHPNYAKEKDKLDLMLSLAQGYYQLASNTKNQTVAHDDFGQAAAYIARWLKVTPKPTFDTEYFYASVLYSEATANEKAIDKPTLLLAKDAAEKAIRLSNHPKENLYVLLQAIYSQTEDLEESAKYLEFLVQLSPEKEGYWQLLWAAYMNMASEQKDEESARVYYARAINTLERAQSFHKMVSKKDNYNLATMYYSAGQFGKATDILSAGLNRGTIESTLANWELLSYSYQQIDQPLKAIEALKEAEVKVPDKAADIDFEIAKIYAQLEDSHEAYVYSAAAAAKGGVEKGFNLYQFLAYQAYEEEKYQDALDALNKAAAYPQGKDSKQLDSLRRIILQSLKSAPGAIPTTTQ
jgi:hypothetical protein